jgi:endonuclease G
MKNIILPIVVLIVGCTFASDNLTVGTPSYNGQVVDRIGYALGYSDEHEQPAWVQYRFTKEENQSKIASRSEDFREDLDIKTGSAKLEDYRRSGYDRGHLAPAADMKFSQLAMSESFLLSNMSPQVHEFNGGIWSDLEKFVRYTVNIEKSIYVVTGPIFKNGDKKIGRSGVTVPSAYYKIIYDETEPRKMIAFIVPHHDTDLPLSSFVTTVDEVEKQTGIDFFSRVQGTDTLEASVATSEWRNLASWRRESKGRRTSSRRSKKRTQSELAPLHLNVALTFGTSAHELKAKERYERAPDKGPCWLSINSDKRHNSNCKHFEKSRGRHCEKTEGTPAGCCGG